MGGRGGDINAPNKYASGLGAIAEKEIALKAKIAKAKAQQESVKARYGRSRRGQRDADAARAGAD